MGKPANQPDIKDRLYVIIGLVLAVVLAFVIFLTIHKALVDQATKTTKAGSATVSSTNPYASLSPATVPSKTAECASAITVSSNGNSGPVACSNGDLNVTEWQSLAALEPSVMTLGYNASLTSIQSALCADVRANIANVIEQTVYQISALYYGWNFSTSPTSVITNGTCVNVDD